MKQRMALLVLALLLPAVVFAQAPAPTPAPLAMDDQQEQYPRHAQPPQPPQPHQPDLGKWWKNSDVVRELQLTEQQITQIEKNFLEHRLKLIDLKYDVERQEALLQPLIEADRPDEAKVGAQIDLVLAARGRLEKENTMMMLAIRRVLSVEQWKKLQAMHHDRERMRAPFSGQLPGQMMRRQGPPAAPGTTPPPPRPPDSEQD